NAKGEILLSSVTSQQRNIPSTLAIESPITENDSTNMSSTIESTSTQTFRPETERGYEGSPMSRLISQYKASSDDDISTYQRAINLSAKNYLLQDEVVKLRGSQRRYALQAKLLEEVEQIVNELQVFLERTSALIPERRSYFKVDPKDTFLAILRESSDARQIHAAWL
ncbi:hypothetical protein K443DRAFT_44859, partial [Laccaria amethystina LaAM-08-1]